MTPGKRRRRPSFITHHSSFIILLLCCACTHDPPPPPPPPVQTTVAAPAPLPARVTAYAPPGGYTWSLRVASDNDTRRRGLMFVKDLPATEGMIFLFPQPGMHPFYMYHTWVPLDMIWIDANGVVQYVEYNAEPCPASEPQDCPTFNQSFPASAVVELAAGQAQAAGIATGSRLTFDPPLGELLTHPSVH